MEKVFEIGDEVEIVGPNRLCITYGKGQAITITKQWNHSTDGMLYSDDDKPWFPASSLRLVEEQHKQGTLSIEDRLIAIEAEIRHNRIEHHAKKHDTIRNWLYAIESCGPEQIPAIVEKLFAIEKRQDKQSTTNELIVDKLEEFMKRQDAQKKRMDFIEAIQKGEIPEDKTMNNPIQIYISRGDVSHQKKVDDPIDGMKFAKKVLDSMRNKGDLKHENYV
jgi:hypothetical protein